MKLAHVKSYQPANVDRRYILKIHVMKMAFLIEQLYKLELYIENSKVKRHPITLLRKPDKSKIKKWGALRTWIKILL